MLFFFQAIDKDGTQENSAVVGTYFLEELLKVQQEYPEVVGDVRGKGLMIGVELVTDKVIIIIIIIIIVIIIIIMLVSSISTEWFSICWNPSY